MEEELSKMLQHSQAVKMKKYQSLLNRDDITLIQGEKVFWDIVVLTACDSLQVPIPLPVETNDNLSSEILYNGPRVAGCQFSCSIEEKAGQT
jgi:hypothetical protein